MHLEEYKYLGLSTPVIRNRPSANSKLTYVKEAGESDGDAGDKYAGLDRFGRIVDQRWLRTTPGTNAAHVDRFKYAYDENSNPLYKEDGVDSTYSELYHSNGTNSAGYDKLNRLTDWRRGTLSDANGDGVYDTVSSASRTQSWTLDAAGNMDSIDTSGTTATRTHNRQNQITSGGATYDDAGNLLTGNSNLTFTYDAWGRLHEIRTSSYLEIRTHDADGRISHRDYALGGSQDHYYGGEGDWQALLDVGSGSESITRQTVWSPAYEDAPILTQTTSGTSRRYFQTDAGWNTTSLIDTASGVTNRYRYDAYGDVTFLSATFTTVASQAHQYLYKGGRYDRVAKTFEFDHRDYSALLSRFIQADLSGYPDGVNRYQPFLSSPIYWLDPSGLDSYDAIISDMMRDRTKLDQEFADRWRGPLPAESQVALAAEYSSRANAIIAAAMQRANWLPPPAPNYSDPNL